MPYGASFGTIHFCSIKFILVSLCIYDEPTCNNVMDPCAKDRGARGLGSGPSDHIQFNSNPVAILGQVDWADGVGCYSRGQGLMTPCGRRCFPQPLLHSVMPLARGLRRMRDGARVTHISTMLLLHLCKRRAVSCGRARLREDLQSFLSLWNSSKLPYCHRERL